MQYLTLLTIFFLSLINLTGCSDQKKSGRLEETITISMQQSENTLFYTGSISPIKSIVLPSPVEGVIVEMPFQYGEVVKPGDLLFLISSEKFLTDYKTALMNYVKAKNEFDNNKTQLSESEFLHKNELISDDEYKMKKSNYYSAQLGLLQAKEMLEVLIRQLNLNDINFYNLSIADIDKITNAIHLNERNDSYLKIISPVKGVMLGASKTEEENKKFNKGDTVKTSDVLAMIGDMTGLAINIKVNELTVNQLVVGQKVKVTGIAFPDETLQGEINRVDRQGETINGGVPNFTVKVIVPQLTEQQKKIIHVGMTAKIEINLREKSSIMIPIQAITEEDGVSYVTLNDNGYFKKRAVKTGRTTIDAVAIINGLKPGDKIVFSH